MLFNLNNGKKLGAKEIRFNEGILDAKTKATRFAMKADELKKHGVRLEDVKDLNNPTPLWINILIKHFSGESITTEEIESVNDIHYDTSMQAFYLIPLLILCLENAIEKALN